MAARHDSVLYLDGVTVTFDAEDGVAVATLALPGKVNKINPAFGAALSAGLDAALGLKGLKGPQELMQAISMAM